MFNTANVTTIKIKNLLESYLTNEVLDYIRCHKLGIITTDFKSQFRILQWES